MDSIRRLGLLCVIVLVWRNPYNVSHCRLMSPDDARVGGKPWTENMNNNNNNTQDSIYSAVYTAPACVRIHFGSSGRKSVSAKWPPTCRPRCRLDL